MMLLNYASKKDLKASVGEPLRYTELLSISWGRRCSQFSDVNSDITY